MNQTTRLYKKQTILGMLFYGVVAELSFWVLARFPVGRWRIPIAITPVFAIPFIIRSIVRLFSSFDELQIRIHLQSLAFAFAGTAMLTLTYGFLQNAGLPTANWVWVWPLMGCLFLAGKLLAKRQYQ